MFENSHGPNLAENISKLSNLDVRYLATVERLLNHLAGSDVIFFKSIHKINKQSPILFSVEIDIIYFILI